MSQIKVIPLGAGQDVGRSCIVVSLGGKNVMFDCGMHMGYQDHRRFPNFKYISPAGNYNDVIDVVVVSHFHLDHCGALPYFTEMCGYSGPIIMTYPTKAICPILLEDFRKITVEKKGDTNFFTSAMIKDCMKKVIAVNLHQSLMIDNDFEIKAYYAGHVLGAAMFYLRVGNESVLYTGDYNTTPDRHLGAAQVDKLQVDLLITETTYATTIRDSKRLRERDFLKNVHDTVDKGGKVLIPVFALGRAQELCILIETYWERMNLSVPIYFSAGLVERANLYYKLFINWTNQKIKNTFVKRNMFEFKHIKPFDKALLDKPGPCVLFATPGMLHAGMSLEAFKKWCPNEKNMCIIPGYCVAGTVGHKVIIGQTQVEIDKKNKVQVNCAIRSLSFSAHADAKGIMQLIQQCQPKNVMLCHGEKQKMGFLKQRIQTEFGIPCYTPANGECLTIQNFPPVPLEVSKTAVKSLVEPSPPPQLGHQTLLSPAEERLTGTEFSVDGFVSMKEGESIKFYHHSEASQALGGVPEHTLKFDTTRTLKQPLASFDVLRKALLTGLEGTRHPDGRVVILYSEKDTNQASIRSVAIQLGPDRLAVNVRWNFVDDLIATHVLACIDSLN